MALSGALPAAAQDVTWTGGTGFWNDPGLWDTGVAPGATDDAVVDGGSGNESVVTLIAGTSVGTQRIDAGDAVAVNNGLTFTLTDGALDNDGVCALQSLGAPQP